jgi:hypothetical protein
VPVILALIALILLTVIFMAAMLPFSIAMRYRAGSAKRRAWGWVVTLNFYAALISSTILVLSSAISNVWIPNALRFTVAGLGLGFLLGLVGLALSRWEATHTTLHYTPNRWLILLITLVVSARIFYGFWRAWDAWRTTPAEASWIAHSGAAGSMGAGAAVLGYYVIYWAGVRRKTRKHARGS